MKSLVFLLCLSACLAFGLASAINSPAIEPNYGTLANEVCYEPYGCFSTASPWTSLLRPTSKLPQPPYEVGTRFLLYTRSNQNENYELVPDNEFILKFSPYDSTRRTLFIIHGFTDSDKSDWVVAAKNALLTKEDINLIVVDWAPGASGTYHKAVANARLVGAQLARMLNFLKNKAALNFDQVRLVGHSIGAHVAGYAGHRLEGAIGHITALDTAEPYFGGTDELVRLDQTDAKFIQAIHTNGNNLGLGIAKSFAHADIFPNGGNSQPGCNDLIGTVIGSILDFIFFNFDGPLSRYACSHVRVVDFYVESILSTCPFVAHSCKSYSDYKNGKCTTPCTADGSCTVLGYGSESNTAIRGDFYLNTDSTNVYCLQALRFDAPVNQEQKKTTGTVTVQFRNSNGKVSDKFTIVDGSVSNGQLLNAWLEVSSKVLASAGERPSLTLRYTRGGLLPTTQPKFLSLDSLTLTIVDENLQLQNIKYGGVTLEAGVDLITN